MKIFPEFGSCFSGREASEDADRRLLTADVSGGMTRRLARSRSSAGATATWKPKLTAISEDSPITTVEDPVAAGDDGRKRRMVKEKSKSTTVIAPTFSRGDDYWKSVHTSSSPAFSAMWFAF